MRFAKGQNNLASMEAIQYLLDFSKGQEPMLVATAKDPVKFQAHSHDESTVFLVQLDGAVTRDETQHPAESRQPGPGSSTSSDGGNARAVCSFCGKSFSHLGDHNKHRRRHTGERPFACDACPLRFAHASNLRRHQRLHSGEKPFACGNCHMRFSRRDKLATHIASSACPQNSTPKQSLRDCS